MLVDTFLYLRQGFKRQSQLQHKCVHSRASFKDRKIVVDTSATFDGYQDVVAKYCKVHQHIVAARKDA